MSVSPHRIRSTRGGFTLLELLAALLLASLLMVAVFRLLGIMHTQGATLRASAMAGEAYLPRIFQRLECDFRNSRRMIVRPDEILLTGFASTSSGRSVATQQVATIRWVVRPIAGRDCLYREEQRSRGATNQPVDRQLIAVGVSGISLWFSETSDVPWATGNLASDPWTVLPASIITQLDVNSVVPKSPAKSSASAASQKPSFPFLKSYRRTLLIKMGGS